MGVAVYPRLGKLLRARNLTVAELEHEIRHRYGLSADLETLSRLMDTEAMQRADLEIAGAVAAVLGVGLGDLFDVQIIPVVSEHPTDQADLDPELDRRLTELFDRKARVELSDQEQRELRMLVDDYGRRLHERRIRERAALRGVPVEQVRRESDAEIEQALTWWRELEADPNRRRALAATIRRRRASSAE